MPKLPLEGVSLHTDWAHISIHALLIVLLETTHGKSSLTLITSVVPGGLPDDAVQTFIPEGLNP